MWSPVAVRRRSSRRPIRVFAAASPALARVLGHVLGAAAGLDAHVGSPSPVDLVSEATRLGPDVIATTLACLGREPSACVAPLKAASPATKLILIAPVEECCDACGWPGVDACVPEEALVARLVPVIRGLARSARPPRRRSFARQGRSLP